MSAIGSNERLRVLLVEDNPADVRLVELCLAEARLPPVELVHVDRITDAEARLAEREFDVVLLDLSLPDASGPTTIERACRAAPRAPIVVLTGLSDEEMAVEAVKRGAQDYLVKGELDARLVTRSIRYAVERRRAEETSRRLAGERSARERAEEHAAHSRLLARLSDVLGATLDLRASLAETASLLVPMLARRCWIDVAEDGGELQRFAEACVGDDRSRRDGCDAGLELPLVTRGRCIGVLGLAGLAPSDDEDRRELLRECARKIAIAIDNVQLYRAREEVISVVSHDLRNPLNVISLSLTLLRRDGAPRDLQLRQCDKIGRALTQMNRLIEDLLDVSRLDGGTFPLEREPIDARSVATEALESFRAIADERGLRLEVELAPAPLPVDGDRGRLVQAVANLVGNALKFTPRGGKVVIEARPGDEGNVVLGVRDTGPGIPAEDLPRVFDRFWQGGRESRQGAGLGLAIAKGIAQAHGGRIVVDSEIGVGTSFRITLDRLDDARDAPSYGAAQPLQPLAPG